MNTDKKSLRVILFVDHLDWILGTVAKEIVKSHQHLPFLQFEIITTMDILKHPIATIRHLNTYHLIHWISPHDYLKFSALAVHPKQICTIHHCVPGDNMVPENFKDTIITTVAGLTEKELLTRGFSRNNLIHSGAGVDERPLFHYGIDTSILGPLEKQLCREQIGINTDRPVVGFIGKGSSNPKDRKGTAVFVESLARISRHRPIAALIIGHDWDSIISQLKAAGVEVFYRSAIGLEEMAPMYGALDLYLCTSRIEGGPMPVLESMACQRPVISTPVGIVPELIENGKNGIIIPIGDVQATVNAIEELLSEPERAQEIAKAGYEKVIKYWQWNTILAPFGDIYKNVSTSGIVRKTNILRQTKALAYLFYWSMRTKFGNPGMSS